MSRDTLIHIAFYPDDWIGGVAELTALERGVYITFLALYWSKRGRVRDDDQWLAGQCGGVSTHGYRKVKKRLLEEGKIYVEDGFLHNKRALKTLEQSEHKRQQFSKDGKKTDKKREKNAKKMEKKPEKNPEKNPEKTDILKQDLAENSHFRVPHNHNHNHNHNKDKKEDTNVSSKKNDCDDVQHNDVDEKKAAAKNNLRGTRLNPDWSCSEGLLQAIMTRWHLSRPDIQDQETLFKDYWLGESGNRAVKRDWDAAFRVWCGRSTTSRAPPHSNSVQDQLQKQINLGSRDGWDDIDPENIVI